MSIAFAGLLVREHARKRVGPFFVVLALSGCVQDAKLVQVTADGGVVTYLLKRDSESIYSPFRKEALALIEAQCEGPYSIVREGETKSQSHASGLMEGDDPVLTRRFWGIQFRCESRDKRER